MNVYAASVALLWRTALRIPAPPPQLAPGEGGGAARPDTACRRAAPRPWWSRRPRE
jgi:hypothetical protein